MDFFNVRKEFKKVYLKVCIESAGNKIFIVILLLRDLRLWAE